MGVIQRLPPDVVNRMAAGEVLVRPSNAVKELIENSLDAGATEIAVTLRNGGMTLLQVVDNGKGIAREDLELVCERFATSKLRSFEDLAKMHTYGFRGEALASLSHVSKVSIVSKTKDKECAYVGHYQDGKMTSSRPSAGRDGTCVTANEMFYNIPSRKQSLSNHSEEIAKVSDVLIRFAIHRPDVSFALRTMTSGDFRTSGDGDFRKVVNLLLGKEIADGLQDFGLESKKLKFSMRGCMAKPIAAATAKLQQDRKSRQKFFSLFINGRSVGCPELRRGLDETFAGFSLVCRFVALSLTLDESRVDVNVHPTKSSVLFLEQDEIIEAAVEHIKGVVGEMFDEADPTNSTADYSFSQSMHLRQSVLDSNTSIAADESMEVSFRVFPRIPMPKAKPSSSKEGEKKRVDYQEVRTDNRERRIDEFVVRTPTASSSTTTILEDSFTEEHCNAHDDECDDLENVSMISMVSSQSSLADSDDETFVLDDDALGEESAESKRVFEYDSLRELREEICTRASPTLRELFKSFTFVGCVNAECVVVQFGTSLYMLDLPIILGHLFYQTAIFSFGNFGSYKLESEDPVAVVDLLAQLALAAAPTSSDTGESTEERPAEKLHDFSTFSDESQRIRAEELLSESREMLYDYFAVGFEWVQINGQQRLCLTCLPSLVHFYVPQLEGIARFVAGLVVDVDHSNEKNCFEGVARCVAQLFVLRHRNLDGEAVSAFSQFPWKVLVRQVLMPLVKKMFIPPEQLKEQNTELNNEDGELKTYAQLQTVKHLPTQAEKVASFLRWFHPRNQLTDEQWAEIDAFADPAQRLSDQTSVKTFLFNEGVEECRENGVKLWVTRYVQLFYATRSIAMKKTAEPLPSRLFAH